MNAAFIFIYSSLVSFYLIISAIAFFRSKDVFAMTKLAMMTSFYVFPIALLGIAIQDFEILSSIKLIMLIVINIILSSLVCHLLAMRAIKNKIDPDEKE